MPHVVIMYITARRHHGSAQSTLVFCLDNDLAGRKRAVSLTMEYADKGYYTQLELPTLKDYNEGLLQYRSEQKKQKRLEGSYER